MVKKGFFAMGIFVPRAIETEEEIIRKHGEELINRTFVLKGPEVF